MEKTTLRPATGADALLLGTCLRDEDVREIYAASGQTPLEALHDGLASSSPHAWTLYETETGTPILMGGVRPVPDDLGVVWLLTSPRIERYPVTITRKAKAMLARVFLDGGYRAIANVVAAENHKAVIWLLRLGCVMPHLNVPVGIGGEPFHAFAFRRSDYV